MNRGKFNSAQELREEIESLADDAWSMVPALPDQAQQLWSSVWMPGAVGQDAPTVTLLGSTILVRPTRLRLQLLARSSDCWWRWDESELPWSMTLAEAREVYGTLPAVADDASAACADLTRLRSMVAAEFWPAIDFAIGQITAGK